MPDRAACPCHAQTRGTVLRLCRRNNPELGINTGLGQRWTVARKREVVLRLLRDEPVQLLSRQLGVEIFRLEQWREKAIGGIDASLKQRKGDPVQAELDSAMKRIGELTMQVELLEAKTETFGPLGRRRSRR